MRQKDMNDYALPFAAWELRLYLDTHPDDERALAAYKQLCAAQGGCTYACHTPDGWNTERRLAASTTGTCRACNGAPMTVLATSCPAKQTAVGRWTWIDDPWPWEPEANMIGGNC